jgi:hypothetical protein
VSENVRSVHARFTDEQWTEIGYEAVRRRLSRGRTVAELALAALASSRDDATPAVPVGSAAPTMRDPDDAPAGQLAASHVQPRAAQLGVCG